VVSSVCVSFLSCVVTCCSLASWVGLKPSFVRVSCMAVACFGGVVCWIFFMPAFSKNGLYLAMTAVVSAYGVPHWGRVSRTSFCPRPIVRYFGWTTMRIMLLSFWFSSVSGMCGKAFLRPVAAGAGYVYTMAPQVSLWRTALKIRRMAPVLWLR